MYCPPPLLAYWDEEWFGSGSGDYVIDGGVQWDWETECTGDAPDDDDFSWSRWGDDEGENDWDDEDEPECHYQVRETESASSSSDGDETDDTSGYTPINLVNKDTFKNAAYSKTNDCLTGAKAILDNYPLTKGKYGDSQHVYQLFTKQNGGIVPTNPKNADYAKACIDRHLENGRPIIVGVCFDVWQTINDGVTDHFVVITGRGYDEADKAYYYTYVETGVSNSDIATDPEENRFYYNDLLKDWVDEEGYRKEISYIMTQVRPNDGETANTTPQPSKK